MKIKGKFEFGSAVPYRLPPGLNALIKILFKGLTDIGAFA